jgi:hypothetical protein
MMKKTNFKSGKSQKKWVVTKKRNNTLSKMCNSGIVPFLMKGVGTSNASSGGAGLY